MEKKKKGEARSPTSHSDRFKTGKGAGADYKGGRKAPLIRPKKKWFHGKTRVACNQLKGCLQEERKLWL